MMERYVNKVKENVRTGMLPLAIPLLLLIYITGGNGLYAQGLVLDGGLRHLRNNGEHEWAEFTAPPVGKELKLSFDLQDKTVYQTLKLRQQDIKQSWQVKLNGQILGMLDRDEKDKVIFLAVPDGILLPKKNMLLIEQKDMDPDDIMVGEIVLYDKNKDDILSEASVQISIYDADQGQPLPGRITVTNKEGTLQPIGGVSGNDLAIRTGFVYTGSGKASFDLPAGSYTLYASRGFEYGVDSISFHLGPGDQISGTFRIKREVPTEGWISSDTHIHTYTHSGHGDATVEERVLSIAGEGIEFPIITDHNVQVDVEPVAVDEGVRKHFTPVIGNEVTTPVGHFNIFPVAPDTSVPEVKVNNWNVLAQNLQETMDAGVIILNHARDVHSEFRPFDKKSHISNAGINLHGWKIPANSMEVINSGAHQTDMMQLYRDWFGLMNRGYRITPVGSSDSHDVSRYLVGQARTYIRSNDKDPGNIDQAEAVQNFLHGKVMVSFGLLTEIEVDGRYGAGETAIVGDDLVVLLRVLGPSWVQPDQIALFANGKLLRKEAISVKSGSDSGIKWTGSWTLPRPKQDVFLVAVAQGPDPRVPFWPIAKPYQPQSPQWEPRIMGSSGAVWIDADRDGKINSAYEYAKALVEKSEGKLEELLDLLQPYDESVAIQAAGILMEEKRLPDKVTLNRMLATSAPDTRAAFLKIIGELEAAAAGQKSI